MVLVRGAGIDSLYQQRPSYFLDVPCFRHPGSQLVFGGFGMVVWRALVLRNGWAASAGGFPAMVGNVPFLMKDVVLFAASVYLLKRDVVRVSLSAKH